MKAHKFLCLAMASALICCLTACSDDDNEIPASSVPAAVTASFKDMYPNAKDVEWDTNQQYYVADFNVNTFDTEAWFSANGTWAMTETDYGMTISMLPIQVTNAFNNSEYASWLVDDATLYEKPIDSFCIIEVETNGTPEISLIYDTLGNLINKVQGDDFDITPTTDPTAIIF